jgi:D-serine deaminase-like pyridoxal phosphate-dependent protein
LLTSVVSCQPGAGHAVVDAGALALSKDAGASHLGERWRWGMGAVLGHPDLHLTSLSQEHGKTSRPLPLGARLRVLPNHSCLAVPLHAAYQVVRGEQVVDRWEIFQGRE